MGYMAAQEAQHDISHYLIHRYNLIRLHQFNNGLAPAQSEKDLTSCPGSVDHYNERRLCLRNREELYIHLYATFFY